MPAIISRLLFIILCIGFSQSMLQAQQLKAGAALRVLTPSPLLPVSGVSELRNLLRKNKVICLFVHLCLKKVQ
jgi:hypothetical protein